MSGSGEVAQWSDAGSDSDTVMRVTCRREPEPQGLTALTPSNSELKVPASVVPTVPVGTGIQSRSGCSGHQARLGRIASRLS
jgi:hypothetical protein